MIFRQFWKSNPRRNFHVESMSLFPRWFTFQNRWNLDELSTWNFDVVSLANRRRCVLWDEIKNCTKFEYRSQTRSLWLLQHFGIINYHLKVVHLWRFSSPRITFERQSLSFCILCCITNFTIAPRTVPVFNYHFERLKVFGGSYTVRQIVLNFRPKD